MSYDHEVSRFAVSALIGAETFKRLHHTVDASDGLSESEAYLALRFALHSVFHLNHQRMDDVSIAHFVSQEGGASQRRQLVSYECS